MSTRNSSKDSSADADDLDLVCLGILVVDAVGKPIDTFPAKGASVYFDSLEMHPGGCAFNTSVAAARLGLRTGVLGIVGHDVFGGLVMDTLRKEGVDTTGIRYSARPTAFSFVMVAADGQRRIFHTAGANQGYSGNDIDREALGKGRALHIAGAGLLPAIDRDVLIEILQWCQNRGVLTSLDPVFKPDIADCVLPFLPHLDLFLPNSDESVLITGLSDPSDQLRFYLDRGARTVGIKLGDQGCLLSDGHECLRLGIYPVPVADTCGAGDAFIAGFLYGKRVGWDLARTATFATATAAFCVTAIGATAGIPDADTVSHFIKENTLCRS